MKPLKAQKQLELIPKAETKPEYRTLSSIWEGTDSELLERMLDFYPKSPPQLILDATVNVGRFWKGSKYPVIGIDIDPTHRPDIIANNLRMPFKDEGFDVVVFDPPHIPNQGKDRSKDFNSRFGLVVKSSIDNGYNFSHLFPPFVEEAYRVLKPEGILFTKITDYVHGHRYQWAHVELIKAASSVGFCPCDCIVKIRRGPIMSPKWKNAHHTRRHHCYWLIFRKSTKCE
jgi:SAM-dependent methyltransferase